MMGVVVVLVVLLWQAFVVVVGMGVVVLVPSTPARVKFVTLTPSSIKFKKEKSSMMDTETSVVSVSSSSPSSDDLAWMDCKVVMESCTV
jgi:hypothetical protein